jgi:hypothetical protein
MQKLLCPLQHFHAVVFSGDASAVAKAGGVKLAGVSGCTAAVECFALYHETVIARFILGFMTAPLGFILGFMTAPLGFMSVVQGQCPASAPLGQRAPGSSPCVAAGGTGCKRLCVPRLVGQSPGSSCHQ